MGLRVAAGVLLALLSAAAAQARHHDRDAAPPPGQFDYYLLSLSWSPAFCLDAPDADECRGPRSFGLIVHGLWPQVDGGPRIGHCDAHRRPDDALVDGIADLMPARGLVYHEWSEHGSCSGLEPAGYFATVRRAREQFTVPAELRAPAAPVVQRTAALVASLRAANPGFPDGSLFVTCTRQDVPRLREVRACLDRDLAPRRCAGDVLRGACRAPQLLVPPVR